MNELKVKATIACDTCGCATKKTKTIKVMSSTREDAINEANAKITKWKNGLKVQNCKTCASIIRDLAA